MSESFIDQIIDIAGTNDWCMKWGCITCGAYKFRAEIERAAAIRIIEKRQIVDANKSDNFYKCLEDIASNISKNMKPMTGLNKNNRLETDIFHFLQGEVANDLKKSNSCNDDAIRIVLNDFDLENNVIDFEGTPVGNRIKCFIQQDEVIKNKLSPKPIKIIVIDVKKQHIFFKNVNGPILGNVESVEIAIGESDRETESAKVDINGKTIGIIFGLGSRDLTGHFWRIKSSNQCFFGNGALLCEDDISISYGPFYGDDCPLKLEDVVKEIVWGQCDSSDRENEFERDGKLTDIVGADH
jgi:hypothetical protein